jgi:hypothetical protein
MSAISSMSIQQRADAILKETNVYQPGMTKGDKAALRGDFIDMLLAQLDALAQDVQTYGGEILVPDHSKDML